MSLALDNSGSLIDFSASPTDVSGGGIMDTLRGWVAQAPAAVQSVVDTIPKIYQAAGAIQGAVKAGPAAQQIAQEAIYNEKTVGLRAPNFVLLGVGAIALFLILRK